METQMRVRDLDGREVVWENSWQRWSLRSITTDAGLPVWTLIAEGDVVLNGSMSLFQDLARAIDRLADRRDGWEPPPPPAPAPRRERPAGWGRPWTADDDAALRERFDAGDDVATLATRFERSRAAIEARLSKHGLIAAKKGRWPERPRPGDASGPSEAAPPLPPLPPE